MHRGVPNINIINLRRGHSNKVQNPNVQPEVARKVFATESKVRTLRDTIRPFKIS